MKRLISAVILVAVLSLAGFLIWQKFYSCDETCRILSADTYGGKTQQETVDLLTDALRKEDVDLASKYFKINDQEKWHKTLSVFKKSGLLDEMAGDIEKNPNSIELKLNEYSGVWKIVNFQ